MKRNFSIEPDVSVGQFVTWNRDMGSTERDRECKTLCKPYEDYYGTKVYRIREIRILTGDAVRECMVFPYTLVLETLDGKPIHHLAFDRGKKDCDEEGLAEFNRCWFEVVPEYQLAA